MQSFQLIANRFNDEVDFDFSQIAFRTTTAFCSAGLKSGVMSGRGDYLPG